ncbi:MAG: carbon storage regulator [Gammaproteobacteria bacterium]
MLVLARKPGQSIRIGSDAVLTLLAVSRERVTVRVMTNRTVLLRVRDQSMALPPGRTAALVCTQGERLLIGPEILVCISAIQRGRALIAVEADRSIPVDREEVYLRRVQERG